MNLFNHLEKYQILPLLVLLVKKKLSFTLLKIFFKNIISIGKYNIIYNFNININEKILLIN